MEAIIFLAPISAFDQVLVEDKNVNRLVSRLSGEAERVGSELLLVVMDEITLPKAFFPYVLSPSCTVLPLLRGLDSHSDAHLTHLPPLRIHPC